MCLNFNPEDFKKIRELKEIRQENNDFGWLLSDYLNNCPDQITSSLVKSCNGDDTLPDETIYVALLTGFCGLDMEHRNKDKKLADTYFRPAVNRLETELFGNNPFYRNIRVPETEFENCRLTYEKYQPYEAFVCNELTVKPDFREIPSIGFFDREFAFPAVMENNREWMAIKPNEIATMQPALSVIEGSVVTFGLGLGYFTYMASVNPRVESITVVEQNPAIIALFERFILPQFGCREKVHLIQADAYVYVENQMNNQQFDYAFVDLWHDTSDGLALYLRMKENESLHVHTKFMYWIEESLLSALRWQVFDWVIAHAHSYREVTTMLSRAALQKLAASGILHSVWEQNSLHYS
jgi:hypothetical protein